MKKIIISLVALLFAVNVHADECIEDWIFTEGQQTIFKISQCVYSSGGSGYYKLKNLSGEKAEACWTIEFNNGKVNKGCRTMAPQEEGKGSCYSCAPKNSGVSNITLRKFERVGTSKSQ